MYKDFGNWETYDGFSYGSGTSNQEWIISNKTGQIGLFKERKTEFTTDNFSEKIASQIAKIIGIECAEIDLAIRDNRIGVVSYKINSDTENIIEGINYISKIYPLYNRNNLTDEASNEKYSLDMILKSINGLNLESDLFKIFIFDFIIGNTDRHHSNWAILRDSENVKICPLYDNASSLCAYESDERIEKNLASEKWINARIDSSSKSLIRLNGKKVRHSDFVRYIKDNYYSETIQFVCNIKNRLNNSVIEELIYSYKGLLSENKISLLKIYLEEKVKLLSNIYGII